MDKSLLASLDAFGREIYELQYKLTVAAQNGMVYEYDSYGNRSTIFAPDINGEFGVLDARLAMKGYVRRLAAEVGKLAKKYEKLRTEISAEKLPKKKVKPKREYDPFCLNDGNLRYSLEDIPRRHRNRFIDAGITTSVKIAKHISDKGGLGYKIIKGRAVPSNCNVICWQIHENATRRLQAKADAARRQIATDAFKSLKMNKADESALKQYWSKKPVEEIPPEYR